MWCILTYYMRYNFEFALFYSWERRVDVSKEWTNRPGSRMANADDKLSGIAIGQGPVIHTVRHPPASVLWKPLCAIRILNILLCDKNNILQGRTQPLLSLSQARSANMIFLYFQPTRSCTYFYTIVEIGNFAKFVIWTLLGFYFLRFPHSGALFSLRMLLIFSCPGTAIA